MMQRRLYGRSDLIDRLARSEAALVLLTGDSGVGKSEVLRAASASREGWFNAPDRRLAPSSGALQHAFLNGMAEVVAQMIEEQGRAAEIAERLTGAAERLASTMARELGRVAAAELLALVRGRLGPDAGKALAHFFKSLREEMGATLQARLYSAVDQSMAETLAAFAVEVGAFSLGRQVSLSFDAGERLDPDECRLLVDISERLPPNCHVRVGFATDVPARRTAATEIVSLGVGILEIEVPPLDASAIADWLADEGLGRTDVNGVARVTGGYPLHLGDLIPHLKSGGSISDAPPNEQVMLRVAEGWRDLPAGAATAARCLCVLPDPLPRDRLLELTNLESAEYGHVVEQLQWARFFPGIVDGEPWFHERRRDFVLRQLHPAERDAAYSRAATVVWNELSARHDFLYVDLFTRLAEKAAVLHAQDARLEAVLRASEDELAVLAALLELAVPQRNHATDGQELVRHARRFTGSTIDPTSVLTRLEANELIVWAKNEHAAVVIPTWTAYAAAVAHGRSAQILRRTPVPGLASLVSEVGLRPVLDDFSTMHFGVGDPSAAELSQLASGRDAGSGSFRAQSSRRDLLPGLVVRARYAGRPLYAAVQYEDAPTRDAAATSANGATSEIFGETFEVLAAVPTPREVVPTNRFVAAAKRALAPEGHHPSRSGEMRVPLSTPITLERAMELRVETVRLMRARSSELEQGAASVVQPYAIYWDEHNGAWIECLVRGGADQAVHVPDLALRVGDRVFDFFALEQAIGLATEARIYHLRYGSGAGSAHDPVFMELGQRRVQSALFNSAQPRRRIVLEQDILEPLVRESFLLQMADARAFQAITGREKAPVPPTALFVLVVLEEPTPGWVAGAGAQVITVERVSESGDDEVHFQLVQGRTAVRGGFPLAEPPRPNVFEELFGFSGDIGASPGQAGFLRTMHAGLDTLLSEYAGFSEDDLELRWPGETL